MTHLRENEFKTIVQELWKIRFKQLCWLLLPLNGKPAFLYSDVAIQGIHPREPELYYPEMCQTK